MAISWIWQILFYGWTALELFIAIATRTRRGEGKRLDRGSMAILWFTIVASITAAEFVANLQGPNMPGASRWLKIAAIVVLVAGLVVRCIAIVSLGKAFSANVAIRDSQTVYRSGLFRLVRHPSYSGLLLIFVSIAIHERNWLAAVLVTVPNTAALLYRIHVEESALHNAFGPQYQQYCQTTKRLIPGIF